MDHIKCPLPKCITVAPSSLTLNRLRLYSWEGGGGSICFITLTISFFNTLKIKRDINQQDFKIVDLSNLNNFHSLEVVNRISETQQVDKNSD